MASPSLLEGPGADFSGQIQHAYRAQATFPCVYIRWFVDWQTIAIETLGPIPEQRGWTNVARLGRMSLFRYDGPSGGAARAAEPVER